MSPADPLIIERIELVTKVGALNTFINQNPLFKTLPQLEQLLMIQQLGFMEAYLRTLNNRIALC